MITIYLGLVFATMVGCVWYIWREFGIISPPSTPVSNVSARLKSPVSNVAIRRRSFNDDRRPGQRFSPVWLEALYQIGLTKVSNEQMSSMLDALDNALKTDSVELDIDLSLIETNRVATEFIIAIALNLFPFRRLLWNWRMFVLKGLHAIASRNNAGASEFLKGLLSESTPIVT